ncbi:HlyC/CorC family transporter [Candidatus Poribacteria bacterium]|nr:HlyC/CorC family transporter [Candidatus Poribacteria bacterium]
MTPLADAFLAFGLFVILIMSAFFSGIETGVISLDRVTLRQKEEKGDRKAIILGRLLQQPERLLATMLVGSNLTEVAATVLFLIWAIELWGAEQAEILTPLVMTPLLLILGELLPKAVFRHKADTLAPVFARLLDAAVLSLAPVVGNVLRVTNRFTRVFGGSDKRSPLISREDVRFMFIEGEKKGVIQEEEREMIHGVIDFGTTTVREIIVPRIDVVAVSDEATWEEVCDTFEIRRHSRLPVYHEKIDEIVGLIYVFDLMRAGKPLAEHSIKEFIRPLLFIPESKKVHDLLHEFRRKQMFMAIVVDEYGGTAGLVTLEDLIEEIFGEIHDEYDVAELPVKNLGEGLFVLDARMHRDEAEQLLGVRMPEGEYETVAGFILDLLGRIPRKGESFQFDNFQVTILEANDRGVARVKFKLGPRGGPRPDGARPATPKN